MRFPNFLLQSRMYLHNPFQMKEKYLIYSRRSVESSDYWTPSHKDGRRPLCEQSEVCFKYF